MNKCYSCLLLSAGLLSDDQQLAAVNEVVARLESRSHSLKMAALNLLEQLGKKERCQPTRICLTHISTDNVVCRCGGKRSDPGNTPTVDRPQCKFTSYQLFKMCDVGPTQLSTTSEEKLSRVVDTGHQYSYIPHPSLHSAPLPTASNLPCCLQCSEETDWRCEQVCYQQNPLLCT